MTDAPRSLLQRLAHRLLFVAAAPRSASTRIAGIDNEFVITALLNGRDAASSHKLRKVLMDQIGPALAVRKADWNPVDDTVFVAGALLAGATTKGEVP